jgi:addiction module HigA family antidote
MSKTKKLPPVTPGEMLLEEFLKPMGISQYRLAKEIGVPAQRIGEIVAGRRAITADTDGQVRYDTECAKDVLTTALDKIRPWNEVVADTAAHA